jgi:hypothetical protein
MSWHCATCGEQEIPDYDVFIPRPDSDERMHYRRSPYTRITEQRCGPCVKNVPPDTFSCQMCGRKGLTQVAQPFDNSVRYHDARDAGGQFFRCGPCVVETPPAGDTLEYAPMSREQFLARVADILRRSLVDDADFLIRELDKRVLWK